MITKIRLLRPLFYDFNIKIIQTLTFLLQKPARYVFPNVHPTQLYFKTYLPSTHYTLHA